MASPQKFYLLSEGGFTFWLPGHKPSPNELASPATIVPVDLATSGPLQTAQTSVRLYLIGGETCSSYLATNVCRLPMGTCPQQHWSAHQIANEINGLKQKAAADSKHIQGLRYTPGQAPPHGLPSQQQGSAAVVSPQAGGGGGYPQPLPTHQPPVGAYGGPHPAGVAARGSPGFPQPHHTAPPPGGAYGAPHPHYTAGAAGAAPGGMFATGGAGSYPMPAHPHHAPHGGGMMGGPGSKFVSVEDSRRTEDPLPAQLLSKYKGITKETHEKFINQRSVTYLTSLKSTGGIIWLRDFTPMPQHYKMLVQCSTRYTSIKITQVIHCPFSDIERSKPVLLSDQKACTYYLAKGYCSRSDCLHVHRTPEQIKFLVAGMHEELKKMSSEERKAQQERLLQAERSGDGAVMPGAANPHGSGGSANLGNFPYQQSAAAPVASTPVGSTDAAKRSGSASSSSSSSDSDSDSDSSSSSSSSSSSDSDTSVDEETAARGKRDRTD